MIAKTMRKRFTVQGLVNGEICKHTVPATNVDEAKGKFRRAYAKKEVSSLTAKEIPSD